MVQLRDESRPITARGVYEASAYARRVPVYTKGVCSCGRHTVARLALQECGFDRATKELHTRKMCVFKKTREVIRGAKW